MIKLRVVIAQPKLLTILTSPLNLYKQFRKVSFFIFENIIIVKKVLIVVLNSYFRYIHDDAVFEASELYYLTKLRLNQFYGPISTYFLESSTHYNDIEIAI